MSIDAGRAQTYGEVEASLHEITMCDSKDASAELAAVAAFARSLFEMDRRTFEIVRARFLCPRMPLHVLARRHRISTQAVHQALKKAAEKWPAVSVLVGLKLRRH